MTDQYLRPIDGIPIQKNVMVYDVESKQGDSQDPGFSRAFMIGFFDGRFYQPFRNTDSIELKREPWYLRANHLEGCVSKFMRHILDETKPEYQTANTRIFAHNGGRFDSTFVLTWLVEHTHEFAHEIISVQGRAQSIEVWPKFGNRKECSWTFTDSALILQMTLEKAGKVFCPDMPKLTNFPLETHESNAGWEIYNKRDCETLYRAMEKFQDMVTQELGGAIGMTAPATAMKTFRLGFQQEIFKRNAHWRACKAKKTTCEGCLQDWILKSYHGGRTEIFKSHAKNELFYYDINSSYAASMLEPMPVGDCKEYHFDFRRSSNFVETMTRNYAGFIECTVHIPKTCHIPPLPYVWKESKAIKKLIFPTGTFSGIWNWEELKLLSDPLVGGEILEIKRSVWFKKSLVFNDFITTLYKLRDKSAATYDPAMSELAKLLMNSLYGKFGMKRDREILVSIDTGDAWPRNADDTWARPIDGDHDNCKIWIVKNRIDASYIIPQISAHITALSRVRLWEGMAEILRQKGEIYYTDSVAGNRCVPVKDPEGNTYVMPIERLFRKAQCVRRADGKDEGELKDWTALARNRLGQVGWFRIGSIIRHQAKKKLYLLSTKVGQTEVTSDHSIMVERNESLEACSAEEFLKEQREFFQTSIPPEVPTSSRKIDLFEELRGAKVHCRNGKGISEFEGRKSTIGRIGYCVRKTEPEFKRYFTPGSKELHALLRVVGSFVSEGAASLGGRLEPVTATFKTKIAVRYLWSVSQQDRDWILRVRDDMNLLAPTAHMGEPLESVGAYKLHSGGIFLPFMFAVLCGEGHSKNRRLPRFCLDLSREDFLVLWDALVDGDGHIEVSGATAYTTISLELASQLSFLLNKHGMRHAHHYRPDKKCWSIRVSAREGDIRPRRVMKYEIRDSEDAEYVYDLNVPEAGTFVDALGCVLVHNTDSILADRTMEEGAKLGEWKREYPGEILSGNFILPKLYALTRSDGSAVAVKMKGVGRKAQTLENFKKLISGGIVEFTRVEQHRTVLRKKQPGPLLVGAYKQLRTNYDKRIFTSENVSRAICIGEDIQVT